MKKGEAKTEGPFKFSDETQKEPTRRETSSSIEFALRFDGTRKVERECHLDFQVSMQVLGAFVEW